ncbi:MAG: hypothetical protein ACE37I_12340 [Rubinisphaera brasiliensis]|uniref:Amino acid-binding ACT domain protein n=1 Tax=Rubinisphaera brasiliensis (strain ATCC 49424 / DSM 5305 / JCM 21570 / IAM 15109 / NBRC 103401 / IFAM 1448) TaxID=756272 RepID=F0SRA7_RUBBR|nr:amino acid-binding ACT protein [Rubinisphaera brasiliensis]ADY62358.1 amino acid-binding ACT domain protein [Rubinisphaera brasiliensis DSM 5305]MBR9804026.1 hypothetical protein [bacterium]
MQPAYLLTMTARNRSGVLAAVTTALAELGGDMQYTTQAVINGMFTMTIAAEFPPHRTSDVIRDHLLDVGRPYELELVIRETEAQPDSRISQGNRYFLTLTGQDAPGVVRTLCAMLAQELTEIERMYAVPDAPGTFSMVMILNVPDAVDMISLNSDLELFAALNGLTISLEHEKNYDAADLPKTLYPGMVSGSSGMI